MRHVDRCHRETTIRARVASEPLSIHTRLGKSESSKKEHIRYTLMKNNFCLKTNQLSVLPKKQPMLRIDQA